MPKKIQYTPAGNDGFEFLRLAFKPAVITLSGHKIDLRSTIDKEGYMLKDLGNGDYAVTIKRSVAGDVVIKGL